MPRGPNAARGMLAGAFAVAHSRAVIRSGFGVDLCRFVADTPVRGTVPARGMMMAGKSRSAPEVAKRLAEKIGRSDIVLFLGAGVNEKRLPTWDRLLTDVIRHAVHYGLGDWTLAQRRNVISWLTAKHSHQPSVYERASLARRLLREQYLHVVHQKLYKDVGPSFPRAGSLAGIRHETSYLGAVAALCGNEQVRAAVTYNYDDSLEMLMDAEHGRDRRRRTACRLCCPRLVIPRPDALPVYHVHGLLPRRGELIAIDPSTFVFCYEEYFRTLLEPFSWQTVQQLHFLRSAACLFLGVSLQDMNMLRLLSHAREYGDGPGVFLLWCDRDMQLPERRDRDGLVAMRRAFYHEFGVELVLCGEDYRDVHAAVAALAGRLGGSTRRGRA
jgi:hypothetical protein